MQTLKFSQSEHFSLTLKVTRTHIRPLVEAAADCITSPSVAMDLTDTSRGCVLTGAFHLAQCCRWEVGAGSPSTSIFYG